MITYYTKRHGVYMARDDLIEMAYWFPIYIPMPTNEIPNWYAGG